MLTFLPLFLSRWRRSPRLQIKRSTPIPHVHRSDVSCQFWKSFEIIEGGESINKLPTRPWIWSCDCRAWHVSRFPPALSRCSKHLRRLWRFFWTRLKDQVVELSCVIMRSVMWVIILLLTPFVLLLRQHPHFAVVCWYWTDDHLMQSQFEFASHWETPSWRHY